MTIRRVDNEVGATIWPEGSLVMPVRLLRLVSPRLERKLENACCSLNLSGFPHPFLNRGCELLPDTEDYFKGTELSQRLSVM